MEPELRPPLASQEASVNCAATLICRFVEAHADPLLGILRSYVKHARLTELAISREGEDPVRRAAEELLNEVLVVALEKAEQFDPARQPMAWLLGIAANLLNRKRVEHAKRSRREVFVADLTAESEIFSNDVEIFERLAKLSVESAARDFESDDEVRFMLSLVSEDDRNLLRLALIEGLDGEAQARALGKTPGATRVHLHRAVRRLQQAWLDHQNRKGGERNV